MQNNIKTDPYVHRLESPNLKSKTTIRNILIGSTIITSLAAFSAHALELRTYDLDSFTGIKVAQGITLKASVSDEQSIQASGSEKALKRLKLTVIDDRLDIRMKPRVGWGWSNSGNITVTVTSKLLTMVDASSGSSAHVKNINADQFSVDASSGASVTLSGTCKNISADGSSGSSIRAKDLLCDSAAADISSGASMSLHANETFAGDASSGASLTVYGSPEDYSIDESSGASISIK